MILVKKFSEKEVLEIIAKHASEELPKTSKGIIEAKYTKDNEINVYFIEQQKNEVPS